MSAAPKLSTPRERPILFSAPMVRAILEGRKTQTRRVIKPQPRTDDTLELIDVAKLAGVPFWPGYQLWVRETWGQSAHERVLYRADPEQVERLAHEEQWVSAPRWRPSIFMPRWASRLTLEVTDVRAERLQDISRKDAQAEGAFFTDYGRLCHHDWSGPGPCPAPPEHHPQRDGWSMVPTESADECLGSPQMAFANLWDSINGERAPWESNPWVWAIGFRRLL